MTETENPPDRLRAPFPYFGGKARVSHLVWPRFGEVRNFVEPFFGSGAMLLNRPQPFDGPETVNDKDGFVSNFWRAVTADPEAVARFADGPVNENDLHARHAWLTARKDSIGPMLEGDPDFYDAKIAGWWVWGVCLWIGSGFCSGNGPWSVQERDGFRQLVHLGTAGQGVNRQLVHLGDGGKGIHRKRQRLSGWAETGVCAAVERKRPILAGAAGGCRLPSEPSELIAWMQALADRLRRVRVCCGDWSRVMGPSVTTKHGLTAVFLDPPYADTADRADLYRCEDMQVAHAVREWAIANGDDPLLRICLCGYEGEHVMPESWECVAWKAAGGYSSQGDGTNENCLKERLWFSPHCVPVVAPQMDFFST